MTRDEIGAFFQKYGSMVYRRARYILGSHEDAEEATQEVFRRVLQKGEGFQQRSRVYTWLYRITTNYCLNQIRDRRRRDELWELEKGREGPPVPHQPAPDKGIQMRRLLSEAEPEQARAAVCVYLDGMSHSEAAKVLSVSRRTVGNLLARFNRWAVDYLEGGGAGGLAS